VAQAADAVGVGKFTSPNATLWMRLARLLAGFGRAVGRERSVARASSVQPLNGTRLLLPGGWPREPDREHH
jgi:hypothetical protein